MKSAEEWFHEVWDETTETFAVEYLVEAVREEMRQEMAEHFVVRAKNAINDGLPLKASHYGEASYVVRDFGRSKP